MGLTATQQRKRPISFGFKMFPGFSIKFLNLVVLVTNKTGIDCHATTQVSHLAL